MRPWFQPLRHLAAAGFVLACVASVRAELAASSPFLPTAASSAATPTAGAPLEFRGLIDLPDEGVKVRIYDPAKKAGAFLRVSERDATLDLVVKQYDAAHDTATVEYHGQTLVLQMHESKVTSSGAAMPNIPMGGIPMPTAVAQPVTPNATPADDQRRLEAVAAEVARRRALREQSAQQTIQGIPATQQAAQQINPGIPPPASGYQQSQPGVQPQNANAPQQRVQRPNRNRPQSP